MSRRARHDPDAPLDFLAEAFAVVSLHSDNGTGDSHTAIQAAAEAIGAAQISSDTAGEKQVVTEVIMPFLQDIFSEVAEEQTVFRRIVEGGKAANAPGSSRTDVAVIATTASRKKVYVGVEVKPQQWMRNAFIQSPVHASAAIAAIRHEPRLANGEPEYKFAARNSNLPLGMTQGEWEAARTGADTAAAVVFIICNSNEQWREAGDPLAFMTGMPASAAGVSQFKGMVAQLERTYPGMPAPHAAFNLQVAKVSLQPRFRIPN
jgi:hypothetical protein